MGLLDYIWDACLRASEDGLSLPKKIFFLLLILTFTDFQRNWSLLNQALRCPFLPSSPNLPFLSHYNFFLICSLDFVWNFLCEAKSEWSNEEICNSAKSVSIFNCSLESAGACCQDIDLRLTVSGSFLGFYISLLNDAGWVIVPSHTSLSCDSVTEVMAPSWKP